MDPITYFKLQAKNLLKDYKTQKSVFDEAINGYLYEYSPKYFNIDGIFLDYDWDEENFSLMKAQHLIALMVGYKKWADLVNASDAELELAKLLFDNQDKIHIEEWDMYMARTEHDNKMTFTAKERLEIFKQVFHNVEGHESYFQDYRLNRAK